MILSHRRHRTPTHLSRIYTITIHHPLIAKLKSNYGVNTSRIHRHQSKDHYSTVHSTTTFGPFSRPMRSQKYNSHHGSEHPSAQILSHPTPVTSTAPTPSAHLATAVAPSQTHAPSHTTPPSLPLKHQNYPNQLTNHGLKATNLEHKTHHALHALALKQRLLNQERWQNHHHH